MAAECDETGRRGRQPTSNRPAYVALCLVALVTLVTQNSKDGFESGPTAGLVSHTGGGK